MKTKLIPKNLSLKSRMVICVVFLVIIFSVIISAVSYIEFEEALSLDDNLTQYSRSVVTFISSHHNYEQMRKEANIYFPAKFGKDCLGYKVWFDNGTLISQSKDFDTLNIINELNDPPQTSESKTFNTTIKDEQSKAIWTKCSLTDLKLPFKSNLNVIIILSNEEVLTEIAEFLGMLIIVGGILIIVTIIATMLFVKWGLEPISDLTSDIMEITNLQLMKSDFIAHSDEKCPEELQPFITAFNQLLERLSEFIRKQQQFTGDASHEILTPIAVIKSSLQIARSHERDIDYYKATIDESLDDINNLEKLAGQLLNLAQIDEGFLGSTAEIDLSELAWEVCDRYQQQLASNNRKINLQLEDAAFTCNSQLIDRMLSNLIENAIKYGQADKDISLSITKKSNEIIITVHDEGGNLKQNDIEKIFNRFYRVDKARSRETGGSGLGLAIVKEIVLLYNGTIDVISNPNHGTDFIIKFPK